LCRYFIASALSIISAVCGSFSFFDSHSFSPWVFREEKKGMNKEEAESAEIDP
jgi:hypothetical protein